MECVSISCEGLKTRLEMSIRDAVVDIIIKILNEETTETEAVYRTLVGLGNFVCVIIITLSVVHINFHIYQAHSATTQHAPLTSTHMGDIQKILPAFSKQFTDSRVSNVCRDIALYL